MSGQHAIGVDVGGTKILAGLVDRDGTVLERRERVTPTASQDAFLGALDAAVEELLPASPVALGIGIPSTIDQRAGRAVSSVNVPLADLDVRARMGERFGLPVAIDNDANAAAIAEWRVGAGTGTTDMVMLTLGTGVGGGLILNGRPYRGSVGAGAELGHAVLVDDGPACPCGGRGHVEVYVSGRAATAVARALWGDGADARLLVARAGEGDVPARDALAGIGRRLGAVIVSLVNVFNPERVVVGGGFAAAGELLLAPAREVVAEEALPPGRDLVRIVQAELGPAAGLVGAGLVAFEALDALV